MENNIKRSLLKRAFAGHYVERRLVEELRTYKDVVRLYPEEKELAEDLARACEVSDLINKGAFGSYSQEPPSIWVTPMDIPFGKHWFQITSVDFGTYGVCYFLKSLRYFPGVEFPTSNTRNDVDYQPITLEDVKESVKKLHVYIKDNLNINGLIGFIRFLIILVTALCMGLFKLVFFTGDFSIKLMRELNLFIDASTPMFLGFLEFISKVVGGFYILIAMLWSRSTRKNNPPNVYPNQPAIAYRRR